MKAGATSFEWATFQVVLGLEEDLLPVATGKDLRISPASTLTSTGKTPSRLNADGEVVGIARWTEKVTKAKEIDHWEQDHRLGICVQTRYARALDVDITDAPLAREVEDFVKEQGYKFSKRTRSNSPKFLLMLAVKGKLSKRIIKTAGGAIEFLGNGQQFVACGTHTSGVRYEWEGGLPEDIQEITEEECLALLDALQAKFGVGEMVTSRVSEDRLKGAVAGNPVVEALHDRGMVKKIDRVSGRVDVECPWAEEHTGPSSVSATSFFPAHTGGHANDAFVCKHAHCAERGVRELQEFLGMGVSADFAVLAEEMAGEGEGEGEGDKPAGAKYKTFIPLSEYIADDDEEDPWLIQDTVPGGDIGIIFGPSGSGKTFITLDMAMAVGRGLTWRGKDVDPGQVAVICAEGRKGFKRRCKAYVQHHGVDPRDHGVIIADKNVEITDIAGFSKVADDIKSMKNLKMVIVDTLSAFAPGMDENSGAEIGKVFSRLKRLAFKHNCAVLITHHTGKDSGRGMRGWSGLYAGSSVVLSVSKAADGVHTMTVDKQKDGETGEKTNFRLLPLVIGRDKKGRDITSCVVIDAEPSTTAEIESKYVGAAKILLDIIDDHGAFDDGRVPYETLRGLFVQTVVPVANDADLRNARTNFNRIYAKLISDGVLERGDDNTVKIKKNKK